MSDAIGLVLSGGGARGAYEFGALEVLASVLDQPPRIVVGTSAGALGAAYLAAEAHRPLKTAAQRGAEAWGDIEFGDAAGPLLSFGELARLLLYGLEVLGVRGAVVRSLLDPAPQVHTIERLIDFAQLVRNVKRDRLAVAAVVATSYATARSVVFHHGGRTPPADDKRGIDYVPARLAAEHVQASSAIPALFPGVGVDGLWYGDGGTRLNTPLKPALKFDAGRLVVIGLNSVAGPPGDPTKRRPDVFDGAAQIVQALLADQLAHDVNTLATINELVRESGGAITSHRRVPYIFVAPADRLAIGRLASAVYRRHYAGARGLRRSHDLAVLGRLLDAGGNSIRGELLSYLFFAPEFIEPLLEMGRRDAEAWLKRQGRDNPWRDGDP
jgi:NTE family protein